MGTRRDWIDVDMDGVAKILERRGKQFAIYELVQNGWDENVTSIDITFERPEDGRTELVVIDNSPDGFADLTHSYTMFAESYKKADPKKRGAFNLGEKFVLALCDEASITSTTGRVTFDSRGRTRTGNVRREVGTEFRGSLRLRIAEWEAMCQAALMLIPPVPTALNKKLIPFREPLCSWEATLPTVKGDDEGYLRATTQRTAISVYKVNDSETPMLYELGIPVVEIDAKYHISIGQKVPLNTDRDNVTPSYLRTVLVEVLNHTQDLLKEEDASEGWVRTAASDPRCDDAAITKVLGLRYGEKRVINDPSDPEGTKIAITKGYAVVHGGSMTGGEWENAKRAGAIKPAGQVTPSPVPYVTGPNGTPLTEIDPSKWTDGMRKFETLARGVALILLGHPVLVRFTNDMRFLVAAAYGPTHPLTVSKVRIGGNKWFDEGAPDQRFQRWLELLFHEYSHETVSDHLSSEFHEECCRIGAKYAAHLQRKLALSPADGGIAQE